MALPLALGVALGAFGGIANLIQSKNNADAAELNAKRNFLLQYDQYEYQKHLNQLTMEREDNAVQRRMNDLMAAGLDPSLAAGSAASSSGFSSGPAPQKEFTAKADAYALQQAMQMTTQFAQADAQMNLTKQQAAHVKKQNDWFDVNASADLALKVMQENNLKSQALHTDIQTAILSKEYHYLDKWNLPPSVHDSVKAATQIMDVLESDGAKGKAAQLENAMNKVGNASRVVVQNFYDQYRKDVEEQQKRMKEHNDAHKVTPDSGKPEGPGFDMQEYNAYNTRMY